MNTINTKIKILLYMFQLGILSVFSFAQSTYEDPTIEDVVPLFSNVVNIVLALAGIAFVAFIAYGAWKGSMALGDPRGLDSAKQTWTYAIYGFLVIILFFSIVAIIRTFIGVTDPNTSTFNAIIDGILAPMNALLGNIISSS